MKITACQLFEYCLPFLRPLATAGEAASHRRGLLIRITGDTGYSGWGEAAPLPGFSRETLAETRSQLAAIIPQLLQARIPPGVEKLLGGFERWLGRFDLCSSARCALEMAVMNLLAADKKILLARMLSDRASSDIPVNGLITGSPAEATSKARQLLDEGYRTIKIKVGRADPEADARLVQAVSAVLGTAVSLRLDANRAWGWDNALNFACSIEGCKTEYIEEPLNDPAQLRDFAKKTGLPVAIDETTREIEPNNLPGYDFVAAIVLKPTLLGGFESAATFARAASRLGLRAVITSTFESPVGVAALAHFAAAYGTQNTAVGLETVNLFKRPLLTKPISFPAGRINLSQVVEAAESIDLSCLDEVDISGAHHG